MRFALYQRCSRALLDVFYSSTTPTLPVVQRRFRSSAAPQKKFSRPRLNQHRAPTSQKLDNVEEYTPRLDINDTAGIISHFQTNLPRWCKDPLVTRRLKDFGIPEADIPPLLSLFLSSATRGELTSPEAYTQYRLSRFAIRDQAEPQKRLDDTIYTSVLYDWALSPSNQHLIKSTITPTAISNMTRLLKAAKRESPAAEFPLARQLRRKIIMHVGPTNSGKTYNALRALAAARSGCYGGPLRLLAHEIWTRLNRGQIRPLGVDSDADSGTPPPDGNPAWARPCNMITGEEQKFVEGGEALVSCTVEMLMLSQRYDVAVVDEIQMITDVERGWSWTNAVLGLAAREVHLCGEETAVPVVQAILEGTGDEIVVNRYERLTPLLVEKEALGTYANVKKGDAIVGFSRARLFQIKAEVERKTKMRCTVVYGRLPPEIRSMQARLFNDPNSGYDVMIGSDAIGMGLNLKIRRVIFDTIHKWSDGGLKQLSASSIKQIAGRAGRFGMNTEDDPGYVTTLLPTHLSVVADSMTKKPTPLPFARLGPTAETFIRISYALPKNHSTQTLFAAHVHLAGIPDLYRYQNQSHFEYINDVIISERLVLNPKDMYLMFACPAPYRDPVASPVIRRLFRMYSTRYSVPLNDILSGSNWIEILQLTEERMRDPKGKPLPESLDILETFHKILSLYSWMHYRAPVAFSSREEVGEMKPRVESALNWAITMTSKLVKRNRGPVEMVEDGIPHVTSVGKRAGGERGRSRMVVGGR